MCPPPALRPRTLPPPLNRYPLGRHHLMFRPTGLLIAAVTLLVGSTRGQEPDSLPEQAVQLMDGGPRQWFGSDRNAIKAAFCRRNRIDGRTVRNRYAYSSTDSI